MSFIEKLSFNAFNEGTRLVHCVKLAEKLFGEKNTKLAMTAATQAMTTTHSAVMRIL